VLQNEQAKKSPQLPADWEELVTKRLKLKQLVCEQHSGGVVLAVVVLLLQHCCR